MGCGFSNTASASISDPRSANFSTNVSAFGYGRVAERVSIENLSRRTFFSVRQVIFSFTNNNEEQSETQTDNLHVARPFGTLSALCI